MLVQLEIKNFAIISHTIIDFDKGFHVLTGETGAGKSILLEALSILLGKRASKDYIRKGENKAELKAVFFKTPFLNRVCEELGFNIDDDVVILEKEIYQNGRSISKINSSIKSIQLMRKFSDKVIDICGQNDQQSLLKEETFLSMIDDLGGEAHHRLLNEYKTNYEQWRAAYEKLDRIKNQHREEEQLLDLYRYQKQEIENAELVNGEDEQLHDEKRLLSSFEKISSSIQEALSLLSSLDHLSEAATLLQDISSYDDRLKKLSERFDNAFYEMEDIQGDLTQFSDSVEYDEERLNEIMSRLEVIKQMKRKYGDTIPEVLNHLKSIEEKLDEVDNKDQTIETLEKDEKKLRESLETLAEHLHHNRFDIANKVKQNVLNEIRELCMPDAEILFNVEKTDKLMVTGYTKIEFLFNANKGEDLKQLNKIASGGERSRVLLAIKIATKSKQNQTLIFDEVDEGVGGEVGRVIGKKLKSLGEQTQTIAISHLPQVAAKANKHYVIKKSSSENTTLSTIQSLNENERVDEIARMIMGDEKNETTLKQAEEMLRK